MRYYFHTENGEVVHDAEGLELADDVAARREGVSFFAEMLRDRAEVFWMEGRFRVTIIDEAGRPVGEVTADGAGQPHLDPRERS